MALFEFLASTGAAFSRAANDLNLSGPRDIFDRFDAAQPNAFSVAAAVAGLILLAHMTDHLRRSR